MAEGETGAVMALVVLDCPSCGAPLPAASLHEHVTCTYCGETTSAEPDGAAMLRERRSRKEAEALFATLGPGPSWSQQVAAFLVKPMLWLFGFPVLFGVLLWVGRLPERAIESAWEAAFHERLGHVASPVVGWLLGVGFVTAAVVGLLVWSLLGERVEARRELQAALACKPPTTEGGKARCRACEGPLDVDAGALGTRCTHCGADNLVKLPPAWADKAAKIEVTLRLTAETARKRRAVGRRRVVRAASWRVPLVVALLALVALPAARRRSMAGWNDFRWKSAQGIGVSRLIARVEHDVPTHALHSYVRCDDANAREAVFDDARLIAAQSQMCDARGCNLVAMFALTRGDTLRLVHATGRPTHARVALAPRDYLGDDLVLWDGFGDAVLERDVDPTAVGAFTDARIATSGFYKVSLRGASDMAVEPCIIPGP